MANVKVTGGKQLKSNLAGLIPELQRKVLAGMIEGAIIVKRATEHELPITPLDIGNLRASFFITTVLGVKTGANPTFKQEDKKGSKLTARQFSELQTSHKEAVATAQSEVASASKLTLIMGYGANYAIWVHEMDDATTEWSRPGSGAKWFEKAIKNNTDKIFKAIGEKATITQVKGFSTTRSTPAHIETEEIT